MKKLVMVSLLTLLATPAFAKTISVSCKCSYYADYIIQPLLLVGGTQRNATEQDISSCEILDPQGKPVQQGKWGKATDVYKCGLAFMNAIWNCQNMAQSRSGSYDNLRLPSVSIESDACYAAIED